MPVLELSALFYGFLATSELQLPSCHMGTMPSPVWRVVRDSLSTEQAAVLWLELLLSWAEEGSALSRREEGPEDGARVPRRVSISLHSEPAVDLRPG